VKEMIREERSAGAVLFYLDSAVGKIEYLLLNYAAGHWDFPKGNIENGEHELQTAHREIQEETGIHDVEFFKGFRSKIEYHYQRNQRLIQKEVIFFLARTSIRDVTLSYEHNAYSWLAYEKALALLTYKNAKNVLIEAKLFLEKKNSS
jgi:8-oxo-dGTP pyrophosphatase MutT (NUDIX family)